MLKKQTGKMVVTIILLGIFGTVAQVMAQNAPLACQVEAAGGLIWEGNKWSATSFNQGKFILVLEGNNLQSESASKAMHLNAPTICTEVSSGDISCSDEYGGYLIFDPKTLRGTIARIGGGTSSDLSSRDTVSVEVFVCQGY